MLTLIPKRDEPASFSRARKLAWDGFTAASLNFPGGIALGGHTSIREGVLPGGCVAVPFSRAFSTYGALLSKTFGDDVQLEKDPLLLFSLATHGDGFFIYVPPGVCVDSLPLVHGLREKETGAITRVHVVLGKGAELRLHESFELGKTPLCMTYMTCEIEEGGKLFIHSFAEGSQDLITAYRAVLKEDASLTFTCAQEAFFSKSTFRGRLQGRGSSLSFIDFSYVASGAVSERFSSVDHSAPETSSYKYLKKVVADGGFSQYTGKISIHKEGKGSKARQMHRALTLGEKAVCHASPIFDIFQNEAQATHGSTIAPYDEELFFYARSRGLGVEDAKKCMLQAFCDDILRSFPEATKVKLEKRLA